MSEISDIVEVTITRETPMPLGPSFGWTNFVSAAATIAPRIKQYGSIEEINADALAGADSKLFAALYFGQEIRPTRLYVTKKSADTYVQALDAAVLVNNDWYGIAATTVTVADQLAIAAWTEARNKIYVTRAATADILDAVDVDDLASQLQDLSYDRTALVYHHQAATVYAEAPAMGLQLSKQPGSTQWAWKTFAGIPNSTLTVAERNAAVGKNANVYTDRGGRNVFELGKMVSGEWIDTTINVDWLSSEIQNRVWGALANNEKIPYTDDGVNIIVNNVSSVLKDAVRRGILAATPEPIVTAPLVADISSVNKGNRILPDVEFTGTLAGAIVKTQITGRILL